MIGFAGRPTHSLTRTLARSFSRLAARKAMWPSFIGVIYRTNGSLLLLPSSLDATTTDEKAVLPSTAPPAAF